MNPILQADQLTVVRVVWMAETPLRMLLSHCHACNTGNITSGMILVERTSCAMSAGRAYLLLIPECNTIAMVSIWVQMAFARCLMVYVMRYYMMYRMKDMPIARKAITKPSGTLTKTDVVSYQTRSPLGRR